MASGLTADKLAIGNKIQLGLMALGGYFDTSEACGVTIAAREAECDWIVESVTPCSKRGYPYHVEGVNLNSKPGEYGYRFGWDVANLGWRYGWEEQPHYFSCVIPYTSTPTAWHPTEATGPFATLVRGSFPTVDAAVAWGKANLAGNPYSVREYGATAAEYGYTA